MKSFISNLSDNPDRCLSLIRKGTALERHVDLLGWLQGDFQLYLPHQILIAGWGNFEEGSVQHDVLSSLPGMRSYAPGTECLPFVLAKLHARWVSGGRRPCEMPVQEFEYLVGAASLADSFESAIRGMRSAWVHGIADLRGKSDVLYVFLSPDAVRFSEEASASAVASASEALEVLLPFIDTTLRQIAQLAPRTSPQASIKGVSEDAGVLSERETQIMAWVAMGKTNSEIGSILSISGFTVKNHMQRIFQKLNVFNRAQAVSRVTRVSLDV